MQETLITTEKILSESDYKKLRQNRYASFDSGDGARFEKGELSLEDLRNHAAKNGEPKQISGRQELYEQIITNFI